MNKRKKKTNKQGSVANGTGKIQIFKVTNGGSTAFRQVCTGRTCIASINHVAILIQSRFIHVSIPPLFLVLARFFCKTKIAIFVKARGRGAKKMAHVREYPHESSCGQPSSRTKFSFRDRTFVRWIQWFSWFRAVVRLVLSIQPDLPAFFFLHRDSIEIWTSVMFSCSTFGLWWVACVEWLFEPVAAVDGNRFSSNLQWTWCCVCGLEEQRTNSSSSMSPSSWESSRRREKCENPPSQPNKKPPKQLTPNSANYEARLPNRLVRTSHTTCRQGQWHDQQSDRTETAIFCLQNDATVRRTVTTFVWPQTQFYENLHTNFVLQNLPNLWKSPLFSALLFLRQKIYRRTDFTSLSRIYLSRIVEKVPKNLSSYAPDQDEGNKQQCN